MTASKSLPIDNKMDTVNDNLFERDFVTTASGSNHKLNVAKIAARLAQTPKEPYDNAAAQGELLEVISATSETRKRANEAMGISSDTIAAPAPTEVPVAPFEKPDVWGMPTIGSGWCDCGEDHPLDTDWIIDCAEDNAQDPEWMTHKEIIQTAKDVWNYDSVCAFFRMVINDSATAVHGAPAEKYPFQTGVEIVVYFSKIWNGCPEEACEGDEE